MLDTNIKIDKGVPIPKKRVGGPGAPRKSPFWDMEVGDSVFMSKSAASSLNGAIGHVQKKTGKRFTRRSVTEKGVQGIRVWRVE